MNITFGHGFNHNFLYVLWDHMASHKKMWGFSGFYRCLGKSDQSAKICWKMYFFLFYGKGRPFIYSEKCPAYFSKNHMSMENIVLKLRDRKDPNFVKCNPSRFVAMFSLSYSIPNFRSFQPTALDLQPKECQIWSQLKGQYVWHSQKNSHEIFLKLGMES